MKFFNKKNKKNKIENMSIQDILENIDHCSAINNRSILKSLTETGDLSVWLNPSNQQSFKYGNYNVEDFRDWANGKGKILKGKTIEDKQKFMYYALMLEELDLSLFTYFNHLDLLNSEYCTDKVFDIKKLSEKEVVISILSSNIGYLKKEFDYLDVKSIKLNWQKECLGITTTLRQLGFGYSKASNTPEDILNLSWSGGLVFARAYYEYLLEQDIVLPDIKFVNEFK